MNDTNAQTRAEAMRGARLARARMIRRRIVGGALALFVASWILITVVLVSGHDPALAKKSSAGTVASSTGSTTTTTSSATSTPTSSSSSSDNSGSGSVSSVTTSQS
jgi:hypothetical protein